MNERTNSCMTEAEEATIDKITLSIHSTVIIISPGFATIFSPKSSTYKPG